MGPNRHELNQKVKQTRAKRTRTTVEQQSSQWPHDILSLALIYRGGNRYRYVKELVHGHKVKKKKKNLEKLGFRGRLVATEAKLLTTLLCIDPQLPCKFGNM